jgi:hypothetical protein
MKQMNSHFPGYRTMQDPAKRGIAKEGRAIGEAAEADLFSGICSLSVHLSGV